MLENWEMERVNGVFIDHYARMLMEINCYISSSSRLLLVIMVELYVSVIIFMQYGPDFSVTPAILFVNFTL